MKKSSLILVIGGAVLAAGVGVLAYDSITVAPFAAHARTFAEATLEPSSNSSGPGTNGASLTFRQGELTAGEPYLIVMNHNPSDALLQVSLITNAYNMNPPTYNVDKSPYVISFIASQEGGDHLLVQNHSLQRATLTGSFFPGGIGQPFGMDPATFVYTLDYIALTVPIAGVGLLIAGGIIRFRERKKRDSTPQASSQT